MSSRLICYYFAITVLVSINAINANENTLTKTEKWKKETIENAGCPFVSPNQMLVKHVCLMPYYQIDEGPFEADYEVTLVNIELDEVSVLETVEKKNKLTIKISQYLQWREPRIKVNFSESNANLIKLSSKNFVQIWQPNIDLSSNNLLDWESLHQPKLFKEIVVLNEDEESDNNTALLRALKDWRATIYCNFDFASFPFDTHVCDFQQESDNDLTLLFYSTKNITNMNHDASVFNIYISLVGVFDNADTSFYPEGSDTIGFNVTLKRILSPYIFKYYLPTAAIVVVSQISFTIPVSAIPGRVALVVTQFLTLTNIFIYQMSDSPSGAKLNALGVYLLVSLFFVVASLIEFGILLMLIRAKLIDGGPNTAAHKTDEDIQPYEGTKSGKMFSRRASKQSGVAMDQRRARQIKGGRYSVTEKIDFASFVVLMFSYILFNIVYVLQYSN